MNKQLRTWARQFLREVVDELDDANPRYIDWDILASTKHRALAEIVSEVMLDGDDREKQAAAWITGNLRYLPDDAAELLAGLLHNGSSEVRLAAAWAFGGLGDLATPVLSALIDAVDDADEAVRYAAIWSLGQLHAIASPAIPRLLSLARSTTSSKLRDVSIKALAEIEPSQKSVQTFLTKCLSSDDDRIVFQATCGLARARTSPGTAHRKIVTNLAREDGHVAIVSAWALGRLGPKTGVGVPELLRVMAMRYEMPVLHSEIDPNETFEIHSGFVEELAKVLPEIADAAYGDFRVKFFRGAFHPKRATLPRWLHGVASHPWIEKMIRSRVRRQFSQHDVFGDRTVFRELVAQVSDRFVEKLLSNPLLGVKPSAYAKLPGNIRNHIWKLAWKAARKKYRSPAPIGNPLEIAAVPNEPLLELAQRELVSDIRKFVDSLPEEMASVLQSRIFEDMTVAQTAEALNIPPWRVKELSNRGLDWIRREFS